VSTVAGIGASTQGAVGGMGSLSSDEFFKLIFTEMSNQDPLKPNDTSALLDQIANIRSIQSDVDLVDRLGELVGQNELSAGAGLIGRLVSGLSESNQRVTGLVDSVSRTEEGVVLNLGGGVRVPMRDVDRVLEAGTEQAPDGESDA
jgi:flagellar basal-body rod modification protein FlgD